MKDLDSEIPDTLHGPGVSTALLNRADRPHRGRTIELWPELTTQVTDPGSVLSLSPFLQHSELESDWQEMHFLFLCSLRCVSIFSSTDSFHLLHISLQNQKAICFFFVENRKWNARDLVSRSRILSFWAALTFVFLIFSQLHLFLDSGNYYLL